MEEISYSVITRILFNCYLQLDARLGYTVPDFLISGVNFHHFINLLSLLRMWFVILYH